MALSNCPVPEEELGVHTLPEQKLGWFPLCLGLVAELKTKFNKSPLNLSRVSNGCMRRGAELMQCMCMRVCVVSGVQ